MAPSRSAPPQTPVSPRTRRDRCPGVLRPWPAEDGALVRVRLVGGRVTGAALRALSTVAQQHGDGDLHLTGRANLQLRALPQQPDGSLPPGVLAALEATGLVPSRTHDLARNVMASPLTGLSGGRADLRPVLEELDAALQADRALGALPGRFLHVLDDGRGDLLDQPGDLGLVALDASTAQLRHGWSTARDGWGATVPLSGAADALVALARAFLAARGEGPTAAWHVTELTEPRAVAAPQDPDPRVPTAPAEPLAHGGAHVAAPGGVLGPALVAALVARGEQLVVTPWRGVLVSEEVR